VFPPGGGFVEVIYNRNEREVLTTMLWIKNGWATVKPQIFADHTDQNESKFASYL